MRRTVLILAAVSTVLSGAPASAETLEIKPSSPWNVHFAEDKCRLAGFFGEGEDRHALIFEQHWPAGHFGLTIAGPRLRTFRESQSTNLKFFDDQANRETKPFRGDLGEFKHALIFSSATLDPSDESTQAQAEAESSLADGRLPGIDTDFARQIRFVSVRQRSSELRLMTGPMEDAFKVLNQCAEDLVSTWGLDVEQQRTASRRPRWINEEKVVTKIAKSYPRKALSFGEQGILRMRVMVDQSGKVDDCVIIQATIAKKLKSPACDAMAQAQFEPALDAQGQPMRSYFATSISYRIN
jgi:TonB family protein